MLVGKTILITGAGGGIGWGICLECARAGAKVIVTDIDETAGKKVLDDLAKISLGHEFWKLDVRKIEEGKSLIEKIYSRGEKIDVLINNAGVNAGSSFLNMTVDEWDKVYETNIRGHVFLSQLAAKKMVEKKIKGVILFTTSIHQEVVGGCPHYSSSKAALAMLIKEMAAELAEFGIRVNGVAPGGIYVEKHTEDITEASDEPTVLLGGKNGIPRDVGRMMVALASEYWSRHVTGEVVGVNGGQYLKV